MRAVTIAAVLVFAVACSSSSKSSSSSTTSTPKDFSVSLPDGEATVSLSGKLPPGWPSDFPLPADTSPAGSGSLGGTNETAMIAVFTSTQKPADAYAYYTGNTELHPTSAKSLGVGSSYVGTMRISGQFVGSVAVVGREKTYIVVALRSSTSGTTV